MSNTLYITLKWLRVDVDERFKIYYLKLVGFERFVQFFGCVKRIVSNHLV